ncbi:MAG: protein-disulfide reductase DsbD [Acidiferrobacterales bacterium]|nr:protein-disulfide reductase DsbD [Acidiferrobacterales bacterium]
MIISVKTFTNVTNNVKLISIFALLLSSITLAQAQFWSNKQPELLPEEEAFSVVADIQDGVLKVNWSIADDYYMYRENFEIESLSAGVTIDQISFPQGVVEDDPEFGEVEVYFYNADLSADLTREQNADQEIQLKLYGQGCNKPVGVCYPPMQRTVSVLDSSSAGLNAIEGIVANTASQGSTSENLAPNRSQNSTQTSTQKSFLAYVIAAFGAGILLSFTPCVLPMIPILAGVIAGQQNLSKLQSGWLAICYVAGTVVTYIIAGALAGATGAQLQAYFQNIWVIGFICCLLLLLAASLFGWFKIQLPSSIQTKLQTTQVGTRSASISSFSLGLVSALVVGACVSPVLILALGAAITQGDPVLGASIMGAMAIGMGLLLVLFGFGAGWILPKAGAWMNQIQVLFGLMVLGVAVYLIETLGIFPTLYLWSALLLITGLYLWQLASDVPSALFKSAIQTISVAVVCWGLMALVGASVGSASIVKPLENLTLGNSDSNNTVEFTHTTTLDEVNGLLAKAQQANQPVFIDFYADWCLDCKRMQRTTYRQDSVIEALANWAKIEIDVTVTSDKSEEVKRFFDVFGPPATLLFDANGKEFQNLRQYGYLNEADFLSLINQAEAQK